MNKDKEPKIALFIDYDNIAIGLREAGGGEFEVGKILERLLEKGRIIFKRAYADWYLFSEDKRRLHEYAIEMIDIPMRRNIGKNSADIRLVVDALDLCYTKEHIDTFVIGSGDSDFTPLVSKLKENDKEVIGFGLRAATSNLLANSCDEFIFLEDLVSVPLARPMMPTGLTKRQHDAFTLVIDAVAALMRENKDVLWGSLVKDTIRRKRSSFTEGQFGYSSFSLLLEDAARHGLIGLIKDPKSGGTPVVTGFGQIHETPSPSGKSAAPSAKGSSLVVPAQSSLMLPSTPVGEETGRKPASRAKKQEEGPAAAKDEAKTPRRKGRRTLARKPAVAKGDGAESKAAEKKDADVKVSPAAKDEVTVKTKETSSKPRSIRMSRTRAVKPIPEKEVKAAAPEVKPEPVSAGSVSGTKEKPRGIPLKSHIRKRKR
ncbi:MAG: NYN domain-containing protein [bacterium]